MIGTLEVSFGTGARVVGCFLIVIVWLVCSIEMEAESPGAAQLAHQKLSTDAVIKSGRTLFLNSCAHCHGVDARGDEGPDLHDLDISDRRIVKVVKHGIKGEMPSFTKRFSDKEISLLVAYLRSL
jgi:mono/diheme cytochrome c family protein